MYVGECDCAHGVHQAVIVVSDNLPLEPMHLDFFIWRSPLLQCSHLFCVACQIGCFLRDRNIEPRPRPSLLSDPDASANALAQSKASVYVRFEYSMLDVCIDAVQRAAKKGRLNSATSRRQNLGLTVAGILTLFYLWKTPASVLEPFWQK